MKSFPISLLRGTNSLRSYHGDSWTAAVPDCRRLMGAWGEWNWQNVWLGLALGELATLTKANCYLHHYLAALLLNPYPREHCVTPTDMRKNSHHSDKSGSKARATTPQGLGRSSNRPHSTGQGPEQEKRRPLPVMRGCLKQQQQKWPVYNFIRVKSRTVSETRAGSCGGAAMPGKGVQESSLLCVCSAYTGV